MSPFVRLLAALLGLFALLFFAGHAHGQDWVVELDLDDTPWNGPDFIEMGVSEYFDIDIWIGGPNPILSYGASVVNLDGFLEYGGFVPNPPAGWASFATVDSTQNGVGFSATSPVFDTALLPPYRMGTATYHTAVDQSLADLTVPWATWFGTNFETGIIDNVVGATVQVGGTTGTNTSSWGAVKGMFR